jgi:hypothetical protein
MWSSDNTSLVIQPQTEGERTFKIRISKQAVPGLSVVLFNIKFDNWELNEWSEALIEIIK